MHHPTNIIISRTDSIGDVILTLPVACALKEKFPEIKIAFLGKAYTRAIIEACTYIDEFLDINDFLTTDVLVCGEKPQAILHVFPISTVAKRAKKLRIPLRIGTTNRLYHWYTCNKLVKLSRKKSNLHEAQLNLKLLAALGINTPFSLSTIGKMFGLERLQPLAPVYDLYLSKTKYNLILHTKSQGSAREWGMENFIRLVKLLDLTKVHILISGTNNERPFMQPLFDAMGDAITDITGIMTLSQFIVFIKSCDGLVAGSTGPLHIAAALGKNALGIYPPLRPIHPGRWAPLGEQASVFVLDKNCVDCKGKPTTCSCILNIQPLWLANAIHEKAANKPNQTATI